MPGFALISAATVFFIPKTGQKEQEDSSRDSLVVTHPPNNGILWVHYIGISSALMTLPAYTGPMKGSPYRDTIKSRLSVVIYMEMTDTDQSYGHVTVVT